MVLLVRVGVHNRIFMDCPLFHCYFLFNHLEIVCVCQIQLPNKTLKHEDFEANSAGGIFGNFHSPPNRSTDPWVATSDILVIHDDVKNP